MGLGDQCVPVEQWVAERKVIEAAKAFIEHEYHDPEVSTRYRFALRGTVEALLAQEGE
jgi:hypothetical protein